MTSDSRGVLPSNKIRKMTNGRKRIFSYSKVGRILESHIQPSALDLTISDEYGPCCIDPGQILYVPLNEGLKLPKGIHVSSSSRSRYGKVGVIADVVTEDMKKIPPRYDGRLFAKIHSDIFRSELYPGLSLAQMRFFNAPPEDCLLDAGECIKYSGAAIIRDGKQVMHPGLDTKGDKRYVSRKSDRTMLYLRPDAQNHQEFFFGEIPGCKKIDIEAGRLYLYRTAEELRVKKSKNLCVCEMPAMDPSGKLRVSASSFIEWKSWPYRQVLEIIPNKNMTLENGQEICYIVFYRLSGIPDKGYGSTNGNVNNNRLMSNIIGGY